MEMELDVNRLELPEGYEIKGEIGSGGMGWVLQVESELPPRQQALKILKPEFWGSSLFEEMKRNFEKESIRLKENRHPNLVAAYSTFDVKYKIADAVLDLPCFTMELLPEGKARFEDWFLLVEVSFSKKINLFLEACAQLLSTLNFLHSRPDGALLHLDIKGDNVAIVGDEEEFEVKLMDFGVAQYREGEAVTAGGENIELKSTFCNAPAWYKRKNLRRLTDENRAYFVIKREEFLPDIDLHFFQVMAGNALRIIGNDHPVDETGARKIQYLSYWLARMNQDLTKRPEDRFLTAKEALDNMWCVNGWPKRSGQLYGVGSLRLPLGT